MKVIYEGEIDRGVPNGEGTRYSNGRELKGNWKNGTMHGATKMFEMKDGVKVLKYDGEIMDAGEVIPHGEGIYYINERARYEGSQHLGSFQGKGKYIEDNILRYEGQWKNNVPHGMGKKYWKKQDGSREYAEGNFIEGICENAKIYYESGKRNLKREEETDGVTAFAVYEPESSKVIERVTRIILRNKTAKENETSLLQSIDKKGTKVDKTPIKKDAATRKAEKIANTPSHKICVCGKLGICSPPLNTSRTYDESAYNKKLNAFNQKHPTLLMTAKKAEVKAHKDEDKKKKGEKRKQSDI